MPLLLLTAVPLRHRVNNDDDTIGAYDKAPTAAASTTNFVSDRYYSYVPGIGAKSELDCQGSVESHSPCMTREECLEAGINLTAASDYNRCAGPRVTAAEATRVVDAAAAPPSIVITTTSGAQGTSWACALSPAQTRCVRARRRLGPGRKGFAEENDQTGLPSHPQSAYMDERGYG